MLLGLLLLFPLLFGQYFGLERSPASYDLRLSTPADSTRISNNEAHDVRDQGQVTPEHLVTKTSKDSLLRRRSLSGESSSTIVKECPICLAPFQPKDKCFQSGKGNCPHQFHKACIDKWFKTASCCPICRADIKPSDLKQNFMQRAPENHNYMQRAHEFSSHSHGRQQRIPTWAQQSLPGCLLDYGSD